MPLIYSMSENNPEVFSSLARLLGVSSELGFYEVYSIDDPDILAFIPRPVYALIVCCQVEFLAATDRYKEQATLPVYDGSGPEEPVVWFKQTIGHACGLMAFIHSVFNGRTKDYILPDSHLDKILKTAIPLKPQARADLLYNSAILETAHQSVALQGDSTAPMAADPNENHFIAFVVDKGRLWELNGGMKGPLDRGALDEGEDALSEKALNSGVRDFIKAAKDADIDDVRFSVVAVAPALK